MNKNLKCFLSIIIAGSLWGTTGIFTRTLTPLGVSGTDLTFVRAFVTFIAVAVIILFKDKSLFKIDLRDIWQFFCSGIFSFLFFSICYMFSIEKNSLSAAAILLYTAPVFIAIISVPVFKERLTAKSAVALVLAVGGCTLVALNGDIKVTKIGLLYGLGSGIGYALYSIFGKISAKKYSSFTITLYTFLFASIGGIFFTKPKTLILSFGNPKALALTLLCAVVTTLLPYLFYTYGLSRTKASTASIIATVEPVVASLIGFAVFKENLKIFGILGIITVVFAVFLLNYKREENC